MRDKKQEIKTGDMYNPFKIFYGLFIPNAIAENTDLSQSSKLCFGRLVQYAGRNGRCYPKQETLAREIGLKSKSQIYRCIKELEKYKLIKVIKATGDDKLKHKTDSYVFIWNNELFFNKKDEDSKNDTSEDRNENDNDRGVISAHSGSCRNDASYRNKISNEIRSEDFKKSSNNSYQNYALKNSFSKKQNNLDRQQDGSCLSQNSKDTAKPKPIYSFRQIPKSDNNLDKQNQPHKILKVNKPYWDIMLKHGLYVPKSKTSKVYKNTDSLISKLRKGEYFDKIAGYKHLTGKEITVDDFNAVCRDFSLMVNSPEYEPRNQLTKDKIKKWPLSRILYNQDSPKPFNEKSTFATLLEKGATKIKKTKLKDTNPDLTLAIITGAKERFGWDLDNGNRDIAIKASKRFTEFIDKNEKNLDMTAYKYHYPYMNRKAKILFDAIENYQIPDRELVPEFLFGNYTFDKLLPRYFKDDGLWLR